MIENTYNSKQEDYKYKSWIFTWNETGSSFLIEECQLESILKAVSIDYVFQKECVSRAHYQGYIKLENRVRKRTLLNLIRSYCADLPSGAFDNLTITNIRGTDKEAIAYVTKADTRVELPVYSPSLQPYKTSDLAILSTRDRWYLWQSTLAGLLEVYPEGPLKTPDDRTILWIRDSEGCSGKSKLVKYYVHKFSQEIIKLPFGSATQLRSAVCTAGPKKVYFIDIPRTMAREEDLDSVYSVIEDIKNGFVTTCMYGQFKQLLFEPPHIVVFSNKDCPIGKLSRDRWLNYALIGEKLLKLK